MSIKIINEFLDKEAAIITREECVAKMVKKFRLSKREARGLYNLWRRKYLA